MLAGQLALIVAAIFTGAAIYINVAEQPARLTLDDRSALAEWKPAYRRGFAMQATASRRRLPAWAHRLVADRRLALACSARSLLVANWPYTLIAIMPTNKRLMAMRLEAGRTGKPQAHGGHGRRLHAVRTALGALATAMFLWASLA